MKSPGAETVLIEFWECADPARKFCVVSLADARLKFTSKIRNLENTATVTHEWVRGVFLRTAQVRFVSPTDVWRDYRYDHHVVCTNTVF